MFEDNGIWKWALALLVAGLLTVAAGIYQTYEQQDNLGVKSLTTSR